MLSLSLYHTQMFSLSYSKLLPLHSFELLVKVCVCARERERDRERKRK